MALAVKPMLGRGFTASDAEPGHDHVALLTYSLWKDRFGGNRNIIGEQIRIDAVPHTVIGVLPADFRFPKPGPTGTAVNVLPAELLRPLVLPDNPRLTGNHNYDAIVRVKSGTTREAALAQFNASLGAFAKTFPEKIDIRADLIPLSAYAVKKSTRRPPRSAHRGGHCIAGRLFESRGLDACEERTSYCSRPVRSPIVWSA